MMWMIVKVMVMMMTRRMMMAAIEMMWMNRW